MQTEASRVLLETPDGLSRVGRTEEACSRINIYMLKWQMCRDECWSRNECQEGG